MPVRWVQRFVVGIYTPVRFDKSLSSFFKILFDLSDAFFFMGSSFSELLLMLLNLLLKLKPLLHGCVEGLLCFIERCKHALDIFQHSL